MPGTGNNATQYRNLEDAQARIGEFLDNVYNRQRLHSALGYLTPEEFEATLPPTSGPAQVRVEESVAPATVTAEPVKVRTPAPVISGAGELSPSPTATTQAVEAAGADGNHGKPQSRFPTVSHSSLKSRWDSHRSHSRTTTVFLSLNEEQQHQSHVPNFLIGPCFN